VKVSADRARIARILRNLTDNAARYTPQNGTVDIRIDVDAEQVRVGFSNDGNGLIAADLPYLFERFFRGEKSRSRQHGGAGIGLAIVKELVEAHGGTVGAEVTDGKVRVWFALPLVPPQQENRP
jgi:signal transduction histidine kinase